MITALTSPQYVNRVRQDWTANGGVYGDGGVYMATPANNPFAQLGPTLDLVFAGTATDPLDVASTTDDTLSLNFTAEAYQIAAQYAVWGTGGLQAVNFADIVTFTRASTATYFNSAGTLTTATTNEARFDYDPATLLARGFLIEEQRTNILASSVYTANANAWTNGVIGGTGTIAAAAVNSPAGTTAGVFNISGLNGSSYVGVFPTVTASANARTGSVFVRNNGGVKFQIRLIFQTGGTFVSYGTEYDFTTTAFQDGIAGTTVPTSRSVTNVGNGWLRITITGSDNGTGNTQASLQFWGAATTTNYNYLMWGAQIEEAAAGASAAFPTSYIPTTTTALTRSADVASVNTLNPWYNATEGTLFAEVGYQQYNPSSAQHAASFNDTTANNRWTTSFTQTSGFGLALRNTSGAGLIQTQTGNAATVGATNKIALAISTGASLVLNGGTVATNASYAAPTVTQLELGRQLAAGYFNGYLRRITYYPRRLSNADLQTITT